MLLTCIKVIQAQILQAQHPAALCPGAPPSNAHNLAHCTDAPRSSHPGSVPIPGSIPSHPTLTQSSAPGAAASHTPVRAAKAEGRAAVAPGQAVATTSWEWPASHGELARPVQQHRLANRLPAAAPMAAPASRQGAASEGWAWPTSQQLGMQPLGDRLQLAVTTLQDSRLHVNASLPACTGNAAPAGLQSNNGAAPRAAVGHAEGPLQHELAAAFAKRLIDLTMTGRLAQDAAQRAAGTAPPDNSAAPRAPTAHAVGRLQLAADTTMPVRHQKHAPHSLPFPTSVVLNTSPRAPVLLQPGAPVNSCQLRPVLQPGTSWQPGANGVPQPGSFLGGGANAAQPLPALLPGLYVSGAQGRSTLLPAVNSVRQPTSLHSAPDIGALKCVPLNGGQQLQQRLCVPARTSYAASAALRNVQNVLNRDRESTDKTSRARHHPGYQHAPDAALPTACANPLPSDIPYDR